jgi:hypothetical protein
MPILSGAIPIFEVLMATWEQLSEKHPHLVNWMKIRLEWAAKYYTKMDNTHIYIIVMGKNTDYLLVGSCILTPLFQFLIPQ